MFNEMQPRCLHAGLGLGAAVRTHPGCASTNQLEGFWHAPAIADAVTGCEGAHWKPNRAAKILICNRSMRMNHL